MPAAGPPLLASPPQAAPDPSRLRALQIRVFSLSWLSYATYYLTRKNFSAVKTELCDQLHILPSVLGSFDALNKLAYALGQFVHGRRCDRVGPRRVLAFGLLASAATAVVFGATSSLLVFGVCWTLNGFFQASGWPGGVKAMTPWFGRATRGKVMGLWCTNYQAGGLVASLLAGYLLVHYGWRTAFYVPAVLVSAVAVLLLVALVERPEDAGLPPVVDPADAATAAASAAAPPPSFGTFLRLPAIWILGGAYFGLKLIRYSLLDWSAFYLQRQGHYDKGVNVYISVAFEVGGIIGAIAIGWLSDRYFARRRLLLAAPTILALAGAVLLYRATGHLGIAANAAGLALIGFLLFGPDTLISGAAAQDIGGARASGVVAGIINGIGSLGAAVSGPLTPWLAESMGWGAVLSFFIGTALCAGLALLWLALRPAAPSTHETS